MSFGFSVGDFAALGQLAWTIYKSCKDAPESFKNISQEVSSLHLVLKELEETFSNTKLSAAQHSRLEFIEDGCRAVLEDLQCSLNKYNSLGTQSKRTWDRLGWGSKNIVDLRLRLISNTGLLTAFVNTSQIKVQTKLEVFMQEFQDGKHEGSIVSTRTVDSLSPDDRQAWRAIRKELEDIGISVAAFDANKDFIVNWFKTAISTGAFEEQIAEDGPDSSTSRENNFQSLEDPEDETVLSQPLDDQGHDTTLTSTSVDLQGLKLSPEVKGLRLIPPEIKSQRGRRPRAASLIHWFLRYDEEFFKSVLSEDETKIRQLLQKGVDINVKNNQKYTALHLATEKNYESIVALLLKNGAKIDEKDGGGYTALHVSASHGHETVVQLLLENGAKIDKKDRDGYTALHMAASRGNETVGQMLLENGAKIDKKDGDGSTALHLAAKNKQMMVVFLFLEYEVKINKKDGNGYTVLHWAASRGYDTVVQLLLENGGKVDEKDKKGHTALQLAAHHGNETVVQMLWEYEAKINKRDGNGYTVLHWAASHGYDTVVQSMLENGAKIDEKNKYGHTALHLAARSGHEMVVQILLENGAKIDEKAEDGSTALHFAAKNGQKTVVQSLLKKRAKIDEKNKYGYTVLGLAMLCNRREVAGILENSGGRC